MIYNIVRHRHLYFHWKYPNIRRLIFTFYIFSQFNFVWTGNEGLTHSLFQKKIMKTFYITPQNSTNNVLSSIREETMYQKTMFAVLVALCFVGSQASVAVENESAFATGDTWAFGKEIDLMEEISTEIDFIEDNITTELIESEDAIELRNMTGLGLNSFELDNQAVLGFYYTGEIIDDFDQMIHMQTEQSLYSHTVLGTKFTSMLPPAGQHEILLLAKCEGEYDEENDECEDVTIELLDNATGEPIVMQEVNTELSGGMHYVAKVTQDTWWTEDTHELVKTQITVALAASGELTLRNVPNLTFEGVPLLEALDSEPMFECHNGYEEYPFDYANDGWEDCDDGSDEPGNGYDFECEDVTIPMDYVNNGVWDCETGEDEGESDEGPFSDCEDNEEEKEARCYENVEVIYETAVLAMEAEASINLLFDFGDNPMNAMDLPLDENKYWEGELDRLTVSGDLGGKIDIEKPELSICPDNDCDQLPEMQELYSGITDVLQEMHDNETFSITVDRNGDGLPDVITEWNDIFPVYIPETWMDAIFQEIADQAFCDDEESAEEGEECDETAEEEYEKLNLRIENNRFAFGPYNLHDIEEFSPIPYAFETGEKESVRSSDGTSYEGYQVFPTDQCSENNPNRDADDCEGREDDDTNDDDDGIFPDGQARSGHEEDHCEGDPFCDSEIIWFHDAETGHPAYINMDMPNLREEGYTIEMPPISHSEAEEKVEKNADPKNPNKTELINFDSSEKLDDDSELPGFGIIAAGASLLFVSRRFRK